MHSKGILLIVVLLSSRMLQAQQIDSLFLQASLIKLKHAKAYTLAVARLMPAEKYSFKPTPEEMSFGQELLHLSSNMGWLCSAYLSSSKNPFAATDEKLEKKEEIIGVLNKTYDYAIAVLQHFSASRLIDTVSFFAGPMHKLQIINLVNDHQTHHRAQLLVYLRLNGIKPPDYVGW